MVDRDEHRVREAAQAFLAVVDNIYGVYLDATWGFHEIHQQSFKTQAAMLATGHQFAPNSTEIVFSRTRPDDPSTIVQHRTTVGALRERNSRNGANARFLSALCIVGLYSYWEDNARAELAAALGLSGKNDLRSPIMGDLRLLRHSILHHNGIGLPDVERCEVLTGFTTGSPIVLDEHQIEAVVHAIKSYIANVVGGSGQQ